MPDYIKIIGNYFPSAEVELLPGGNPQVYQNLNWVTTPIPQATLDQYDILIAPASGDSSPNIFEFNVFNNLSITIPIGSAVRIVGSETLSDMPTIDFCDSANRATLNCIGVTESDIAPNSVGKIVFFGVEDYDTSNFNIGDTLYIGSNGSLTNVEPISSFHQKIGYVYSKGVNGKIFLNIEQTEDSGNHSINLAFSDDINPYIRKTSSSFVTAARFIWRGTSQLGHPTVSKLIGWSDSISYSSHARLFDVTNGVVLSEINTIASASSPTIFEFPAFSYPANEAIIEIQIKSSLLSSVFISSLSIFF